MIWIGAILGAIFGWAGILFAAGVWFLVAVAKLVVILIVFAAQVTVALITFVIEIGVGLFRAVRARMQPKPPTKGAPS